MNLFKRLFAKKAEKEPRRGQATKASGIDFGIFFFNSSDRGISGNYALHAKMAVRERIAEHEPRVRGSGWHVLSGDLFGPENIQVVLTTTGISPDATRLDSALRQAFAAGRMPEYVPYVIGMFMCSIDALVHADTRMKQDGVAGYLGAGNLPSTAGRRPERGF
jgi:hypothetical protein